MPHTPVHTGAMRITTANRQAPSHAHAALYRWPELALAQADGHPMGDLDAVADLSTWDPDVLRRAALGVIRLRFGYRAAQAARSGEPLTVALALGWRGVGDTARAQREADRLATPTPWLRLWWLALLPLVPLTVVAALVAPSDPGAALFALVSGTPVATAATAAARARTAEVVARGALAVELLTPPPAHPLADVLTRWRKRYDTRTDTRPRAPQRPTHAPRRGLADLGPRVPTGPPTTCWATLRVAPSHV